MSKELKKAIMVRTRLKNKSNQTQTEEDFRKYRQQRHLVVRLNRAARRKVLSQLDPKEVGKDKNFWKTFKPLFTDKKSGQNKIALVENENIVNDDKIICEILNSYFVNITDTLPTTAPPESDIEITSTTDCELHSIQKYRNHPSIVRIKENVGVVDKYEFNFVAPIDVWNEINQLNDSKESSGEIPTDILKLLSGLCIDQITFYINKMFECSKFPDKLKLADVSPIFKADDSTLKFNFRPISLLSALSNFLEQIMAKQMTPFANTRLSSLLSGFRNGYSTQHALFRLIEACHSTLDKNGCVGMVLMDLSKAYDCLSHDLLIAKLAAYGFGLKSLNLFSSYLSHRKQRVKYGNSFSEWQNIESGIPKGSVLGPFLFNFL